MLFFKRIILTIIFISSLSVKSQDNSCLYENLCVGMTKKEAKKEYKTHKEKYTNIDIGNGWVYRTDLYNLRFTPEKGLIGIYFFLQNTKLSGVGYQNTKNGLDMTRQFFEKLGYTVFYENRYWNYPLNFASNYGLLMVDKNKTKVVHLFPSHPPGNFNEHTPGLILTDYDTFMAAYEQIQESINEKQKKTGF